MAQTPFGDVPDRLLGGMRMDDLDRALLSRRGLLRGAVVAGAVAGPVLWVRPGVAATPPAGVHLSFGADAARAVAVSWSTDGTVSRPRVDLGTTTDYGSTVAADTRPVRGTRTDYHHAALTGLLPATTYHYRLRHDGGASPDRTFRTGPADARAPFRFTAFGDQGVGRTQAQTTARITAVDPAFHLHAGDLCYADGSGSGSPEDAFDVNAWDAWFTQNAAVGARGIPWMPAVGNHEMEPGMGPQGYDGVHARFALPANGATGAPHTYWFRYGDVAVLALDANDASYEIPHNAGFLGDAQDTWLARTLSALRKDPRVDFLVVAFHHCMYCSNAVHGSDGGVRARWEGLFDTYGVDLVVNGHNHVYERTHPRRGGLTTGLAPRGATVRPATQGTTYVTAGGGGRSNGLLGFLEGFSTVVEADRSRSRESADWSAVRRDDHNLLVVDVDPSTPEGTATMRLRALLPDGTVIDEVTLQRPVRAARAESPRPSVSPSASPSAAPEPPDDDAGASTAVEVVGGLALLGAAAGAAVVVRRQ